ncbi:MAG TPA: hypothetical protein VN851_23420 [Thermoanaerobaculia bacterium]|nr:hypothetical protein [Thermoanaerobaculia bacterium]
MTTSTDVLPLSDAALVAAFSSAEISARDFRHREHVRVVWALIVEVGEARARERFADSLRRLAVAHGVPGLYHETITMTWMQLVAAAFRATPDCRSSEEFLAAHPELAEKSLVGRFYSPELIGSEEARRTWVPPDREPLPELAVETAAL